MRRIKSRASSATFGRPTRCRRDRHLQNRRYPARCQETTVSGLTRMSASDQLVQIRRTTTQNRRSNRFSLGRGCLCLYTASCCRRATASTAKRCRAIKNARTYASIANRPAIITPILIACAVDLKLLIREAGGALMTHSDFAYLWIASSGQPKFTSRTELPLILFGGAERITRHLAIACATSVCTQQPANHLFIYSTAHIHLFDRTHENANADLIARFFSVFKPDRFRKQ